MAERSTPPTRRDRQRETREKLIFAAREVFSRDGYAGANLESIAREAGFSKGAVYSNFESKAVLFLDVMDTNIAAVFDQGGWDLFERPKELLCAEEEAELQFAMRGFALATLEFIATAARDETLSAELGQRMQVLTKAYAEMALSARVADDPLSEVEVGSLLAALDQGIGLLSLSGVVSVSPQVMRAGMQRLVDPRRSLEEQPEDEDRNEGLFHDDVARQRIYESLHDQQ